MGNSKIPHQPSVHVNFQDVTLGDIKLFSISLTFGTPITILTTLILPARVILMMVMEMMIWLSPNFPKVTRYLLHIYRSYYLVFIHILHNNLNSSLFMENYIERIILNLYMCPTIITRIYNHWLILVLMRGFILNILLPLLNNYTDM